MLWEITVDVKDIAQLYKELMSDFSNLAKFCEEAKELEHRADSKIHNIINELHQTFITQLEREDIYALAQQLDDAVDMIENIIKNLQLYGVSTKRPVLDKFTNLFVEGAEALETAIRGLDEKKMSGIHDKLVAIHKLEDQGDVVFAEAIQDLFKNERDPIELVKWKQIIEDLEGVMDKYQEISNIIGGITVKMS